MIPQRPTENTPITCLARCVDADGSLILQAEITSIERRLFREGYGGGNTPYDTANLTVANVWFDTLQIDGYWGVDTTGYNFRDTIPGIRFTQGGDRYSIEYLVTLASGAGVLTLTFPLVLADNLAN